MVERGEEQGYECPVCKTTENVHRRRGVHFDHEVRCWSDCGAGSWEPDTVYCWHPDCRRNGRLISEAELDLVDDEWVTDGYCSYHNAWRRAVAYVLANKQTVTVDTEGVS